MCLLKHIMDYVQCTTFKTYFQILYESRSLICSRSLHLEIQMKSNFYLFIFWKVIFSIKMEFSKEAENWKAST